MNAEIKTKKKEKNKKSQKKKIKKAKKKVKKAPEKPQVAERIPIEMRIEEEETPLPTRAATLPTKPGNDVVQPVLAFVAALAALVRYWALCDDGW